MHTCSFLAPLLTNSNSSVSKARSKFSGGTNLQHRDNASSQSPFSPRNASTAVRCELTCRGRSSRRSRPSRGAAGWHSARCGQGGCPREEFLSVKGPQAIVLDSSSKIARHHQANNRTNRNNQAKHKATKPNDRS